MCYRELSASVISHEVQDFGIPQLGDAPKKGRRKASSRMYPAVLVMTQTAAVRRQSAGLEGPPEQVTITCPGQVLLRANAGTYWNRIRHWSALSSSGCGEHLGGEVLCNAIKAVPLTILVFISDALVTNESIHGLEEYYFDQDASYRHIARLPVFCSHHQSALSQRLAVLSIEGLVTGLVRLCNAATSSRFRDHFGRALIAIARCVVRRQVVSGQSGPMHSWREHNAKVLAHCSTDLTETDAGKVLGFFNAPWHLQTLEHWCVAGCCSSNRDFEEMLVSVKSR